MYLCDLFVSYNINPASRISVGSGVVALSVLVLRQKVQLGNSQMDTARCCEP